MYLFNRDSTVLKGAPNLPVHCSRTSASSCFNCASGKKKKTSVLCPYAQTGFGTGLHSSAQWKVLHRAPRMGDSSWPERNVEHRILHMCAHARFEIRQEKETQLSPCRLLRKDAPPYCLPCCWLLPHGVNHPQRLSGVRM